MSARARRRPKHRPPTKAAPTSEQQYRRMVPALLQAERDAADRIEDIVRTVVNLAETTVRSVGGIAEMRTQVEGLAAALTAQDPARPYEVPPSALRIADIDPDGALWAAVTAGDEQRAAEVLGRLAAAVLAREGARSG